MESSRLLSVSQACGGIAAPQRWLQPRRLTSGAAPQRLCVRTPVSASAFVNSNESSSGYTGYVPGSYDPMQEYQPGSFEPTGAWAPGAYDPAEVFSVEAAAAFENDGPSGPEFTSALSTRATVLALFATLRADVRQLRESSVQLAEQLKESSAQHATSLKEAVGRLERSDAELASQLKESSAMLAARLVQFKDTSAEQTEMLSLAISNIERGLDRAEDSLLAALERARDLASLEAAARVTQDVRQIEQDMELQVAHMQQQVRRQSQPGQ